MAQQCPCAPFSLLPVRINSLRPLRRVSPPNFRPVFATRLVPFSSPRLFSGAGRGRKRALLVTRVSSADEFTALRPATRQDVTKPERKLNPDQSSKQSVVATTCKEAEVPVTSPVLRAPISSPLNLSRPQQTAINLDGKSSPPVNSVAKISTAEAPPTLPPSSLQQQMRQFMDHLHQLQLRMKKNKPRNAAEAPAAGPTPVRSGLPLVARVVSSNARKHAISEPSSGSRNVLTSRLPTPNSVVPVKRPAVLPPDSMWKIASRPVLAKKGPVSTAQPVRSVQPLRLHRANSNSSSQEIRQFDAISAGTSQVSLPNESPHYKTLLKMQKLPIRVTAVPNTPHVKRKLTLAIHNPLSSPVRRPGGNQENQKMAKSPMVLDLSK